MWTLKTIMAHARSTRVASIVYALKRRGDPARNSTRPRVREQLRRAYLKVNIGWLPERLDPEMRHRVNAIYGSSNEDTALASPLSRLPRLPDMVGGSERVR